MTFKQIKQVKFAVQIQWMKLNRLLYFLSAVSLIYVIAVGSGGCAQIGAPTGGPRDTIPPRLVNASPKPNSINVTGNKITLTFNEYVNLKEPQTNVLISPFPKRQPQVDYKLKTVTVKLKDTLLPNTTYSINFGKAIVDVNEGNILKDFVYVFSTGNIIDSFKLAGKVFNRNGAVSSHGNNNLRIALMYNLFLNTDFLLRQYPLKQKSGFKAALLF